MQGTNVESILHHAAQFRKAYVKACSQSLKSYEFSPSEIEILLFLSNNKHIDTAKELCVYLHQSKALVARSVDRLCSRGLVASVEDENDRRIHRLLLKEDSDGVVELIQQGQKEFGAWITKGIGKEEWSQMLQVMHRIDENIALVLEGDGYDE